MPLQPKNYLSLTRKDSNGLIVLLLLIVLVLAAPAVYRQLHPYQTVSLKGFNEAAARLPKMDSDTAATQLAKLFSFNPNHLPAKQWQKLGLSQKQISIIQHYEEKGGRFYSKQDLQKIYAITPADYQRLEPYISLPDKSTYAAKGNVIVELNSADTTKLKQLHGIGEGFARSIIRYRDRLGGFYSKEQLKEIYGLDSATYFEILPQVRVDARKIVPININRPNKDRLLVFPYLTYKQKNAIVEYRNQHGDYTSLADLKNILIIDAGILRKIEPYISFK